jgi:hypothetical protein
MRRQLIITSIAMASIAATMAACTSTSQPPAKPVAPTPTAAPAAPAPPVARSAADMADHAGDSPETAIPVPVDAPNDGIDFQNQWIFGRYGRFMRLKWGIAHAPAGDAERLYKVITVKLPDESQRTVYFDITEQWKNWKPEQPVPQPH